jgi:ribosomal protein L32E
MAHRGGEDRRLLAVEQRVAALWRRPSASAGSIRLRMRTLAKVPRIITSWWPRRAP